MAKTTAKLPLKSVTDRASSIEPLAVSPMDAGRLLGVGLTKVYELIGSGDLPSTQLGRRRLIPVAAIRGIVERAA